MHCVPRLQRAQRTQIFDIVRIGMANTMRTFTFHHLFLAAPNLLEQTHVMVAGIMDGTMPAPTSDRQMNKQFLRGMLQLNNVEVQFEIGQNRCRHLAIPFPNKLLVVSSQKRIHEVGNQMIDDNVDTFLVYAHGDTAATTAPISDPKPIAAKPTTTDVTAANSGHVFGVGSGSTHASMEPGSGPW